MAVIWKYELFASHNEFVVPKGATVVSLGAQAGQPCIWMRVPNPDAPKVQRRFVLVGTGHEFDDATHLRFGGTVIMGAPTHLVWHVFEDRRGAEQ